MTSSYNSDEQAAKARVELYNTNAYNQTTNPYGFANNGHRENLIPALNDGGVILTGAGLRFANEALASANEAATKAAMSGADFTATSSTSLAISTGSKTITVQASKGFIAGQKVTIAQTSNPTINYMNGTITSYNATSGEMVVSIGYIAGSGTISSWSLSIQTVADSLPSQTGNADKFLKTDGSNASWEKMDGVNTAEQLDYSANVNCPSSFVVSLNPGSAGLVVTLSSSDEGDMKRLINISNHNAIVKMSGTGFLTVSPNTTAFVMKVDSKWYTVADSVESTSGGIMSFGAGNVFNSGQTSDVSTTRLTDTTFVVSYRDSGNSGYGTSILGTVANGSITFGSEVVFNSGSTYETSSSRLTDTTFVVSYMDSGNSHYGTSILGIVSNGSITFGSEVVFNSVRTEQISTDRLDDGTFIVSYRDDGNDQYGKCNLGTVILS